jgi:hypothetical protein
MSSSGTESDSSASSDVDFGYQLEPEYTEEELRQMEEAANAQRGACSFWTTFLAQNPKNKK